MKQNVSFTRTNKIFCRGVCLSRDRAPNTDGMPDEEATVYLRECELGLHNVEFDAYQGAVKRFGYKIDLNDEHMRKIAPEIRLNFQEMQTVPASVHAVVYKDEKMFFDSKRHNVPKLVRLGFLLCRHYTAETQVRNFVIYHLFISRSWKCGTLSTQSWKNQFPRPLLKNSCRTCYTLPSI